MSKAKRLLAVLCAVALFLGCAVQVQTSALASEAGQPEAQTVETTGETPVVETAEDVNTEVVVTDPQLVEEPAPVVVEEPAPVVVEEPAPVVVEEPAPVVVEEPAPVVVEEPAPVVVEEPAPVVVEEPAPVVVEEPAPVVEETNTETASEPPVEQEQPKEEKQEETPVEKPTDPVVSPDPEVEEPVQTAENPEKEDETPKEEESLDPAADESAVPGEETETPDETASDTPKSSEEETPEDPIDGEGNQDDLQEPGTEPEAEESAASPIIEVDGEQVELEIGSDPLTVIVKADADGDILLIAEKKSGLKVSYNKKEIESAETENPDYVSFLISVTNGENEVILTAAISGAVKVKAVKATADEPKEENTEKEIAGQEETPAEEKVEETDGEEVEETEKADQTEVTERQVILHSTLDGLLKIEEGTIIELSAELVGFDEDDIAEVVWMYRQEGEPEGTFHTIEAADGLTYSYAINAENAHNEWHIQVTLK